MGFAHSYCRNEKKAILLFNLLAYYSRKRQTYTKYVEAFSASVGKVVGSEAKIIWKVTSCSSTAGGGKRWEAAVTVHYPSTYRLAHLVGIEHSEA